MSSDNWITLGIALLSAAYFTGGFVRLTRNHLKHLADNVTEMKDGFKAVRKSQRVLAQRIERIETVLMKWTSGSRRRRSR